MLIYVCLGILTLSLAFGVAMINTRVAGLIWVAANFLGYQWSVEATRIDPGLTTFAANLSIVFLIIYISIMAMSGIGAAYYTKRKRRDAGAMA